MKLAITIHRNEEPRLVQQFLDKKNDHDFLWGMFEEEHGIITVNDGDCENIEIIEAIIKLLSLAKKQAVSELEDQKQENELTASCDD